MNLPARDSRSNQTSGVLVPTATPGRESERKDALLLIGHGGQTMKTQHTPGPLERAVQSVVRGMDYDTAEARAGALAEASEYLQVATERAPITVYDAATELLAACLQVRDTADALANMLLRKQASLAAGVRGFADLVRVAIAKAEGKS